MLSHVPSLWSNISLLCCQKVVSICGLKFVSHTGLRGICNEQLFILREFSAFSNHDLHGELRKSRHMSRRHSGTWFSGVLGSGGMVELNAFKGLFQPKYLCHSVDLCAACCMCAAS